jgi:hypothetical protein
VLLEVALNANVLWVNREKLNAVRRRVMPIIIGLCLGDRGTWLLTYVNPAGSSWAPTSSCCRSS